MLGENKYSEYQQEEIKQILLRKLDRGIDDMEAGRELPMEEAFQKISELRKKRRNARA